MNLNERNIIVARKPRGRAGFRGNWRRNYNKVQSVQMGTVGARAKAKYSAKSNCLASATMSSSNINWKTPVSKENSSTLNTSTHSSNSKSDVIDDESRIILALSEGRGNATNEVGIAAINLTEPTIVLCQIPDLQSYVHTITKLNILKPIEILIPITCVNANRLTEIIKSKFPDVKITAVSRTWYNNTSGFQNLSDLCGSHWKSTLLTVKHKYYALVAFNALINYLLMELNISYGKESLKIDFQVPNGHAIIDSSTADNLELVTTRRAFYQRYSSLMGVLNRCKTKVGARLLRATILQPPSEVAEINSRLDCVQELMDNPGLLTKIQDSLSKLSCVHQLLTVSILNAATTNDAPTCHPSLRPPPSASQRYLNYLLTLNGLLQQSIPLRDTLVGCQHVYLRNLRELLEMPVIEDLRLLIGKLMCEDAVKASGQLGGLVGRVGLEYCAFVIKPGVCSLLDVVRTKYTDKISEMREYVKSLSNKYGLTLTLTNTSKKGYHMVMQIHKNQRMDFKKSSLPNEFMQIDRLLGSVTMKTTELMSLSDRVEDMLTEIIKLSNIILSRTLVEIRKSTPAFYLVCEYVAKVDMMQSLAEASSVGQTVRPTFGAYTQVIESRHPLLCYLRRQEPVPNDIHISPWYNLNVITGANGSGKSIFIRQVILLQVMAQVGCYVPAKRAVFRVADRIFARVSLNDDMENGASSFVLEMREIDYFLSVLTDNTLIVIDELGRSTSLEAGSAIAFAICRKLLSTKAFTFITTHFSLLPKIQNIYLNVKNWHMETLETDTLMDNKHKTWNFTYILKPDVLTLKRYGMYFARICWPKNVIAEVERAMAEDEAGLEDKLPEVESVHALVRMKYDCEADLQLLPRKTAVAIRERLLKYRKDYRALLKKLNIEQNNPEESLCNNTTADEEMLPILQPIVTLGNSTNNSSTLQGDSDTYASSKLIETNFLCKEKSLSNIASSSKGTTTNYSSSLNWGVNKHNSKSTTPDSSSSVNSINETNDSSSFSSQLSDGTISSQIFQKDQEYLENLERSYRSEADNDSKSKETTTNNSSSTKWGFNIKSFKTSVSTKSKLDTPINSANELDESAKFPRQPSDGSISLQIFQKDMEDLANIERIQRKKIVVLSEIITAPICPSGSLNWNPNVGDFDYQTELNCNITRQRNSFQEIDIESIRSEVESYKDELLSEWDEDENEQNITLNTQNSEHLNIATNVQEDEFVSNNILQEFLVGKFVENYESLENIDEKSRYNHQNTAALHQSHASNDIVDIDCKEQEECESISYSPRADIPDTKQYEQYSNDAQNVATNEENQMDFEEFNEHVISDDGQPQNYSQIIEDRNQSTPNALQIQTAPPYLQNTQEFYENMDYADFEPDNIFAHLPYENYPNDYDVISNADASQSTGFNFGIENIRGQNIKEHALFSQSTEVASNVNSINMVLPRIDENILILTEAVEKNVRPQESYINMTNQQSQKDSSNGDYQNFVYNLETEEQNSSKNNNLKDQEIFHDLNRSASDGIVSEFSKEQPTVRNVGSEVSKNSLYQSFAKSDDTTFKTPCSHSKTTSVIGTTRSSRDLFKSPIIPSKSIFVPPNLIKRKTKFVPPLKQTSEEPVAGTSTQLQAPRNMKKLKRTNKLSNFKLPWKLTRKEIEADFFEQDMELWKSGEQIDENRFSRRPSVKAMQQMTCVVQFDDNGCPIFNENAYSGSTTTKQSNRKSKKFTVPLKYGDSEKTMAFFKDFQNSLNRKSSASNRSDGEYVADMDARPNINLFASVSNYENILSNVEQSNNSAEMDDIMKKYL